MKKPLHITVVAGARPNFMKVAPLLRAFKKEKRIQAVLIHTGQHYDGKMSSVFFKDLGIPKPKYDLNVGSHSHAVQTARVMERFEALLIKHPTQLVVVVGDVNSTVACTLVAKKMGIPVAHVEAGLRSFDDTMPEEINRKVTDCLADFLFTPSPDANVHLRQEGVSPKKIKYVGNIMIDTLHYALKQARQKKREKIPGPYGVVTLHRPALVDNPIRLKAVLQDLNWIAEKVPLYFPVHPRTAKQLKAFKLESLISDSVHLLGPLPYFDFLHTYQHAAMVITDSGGIQEETSALGIPCLTLRENTERPVTLTHGTNTLIGLNSRKLRMTVNQILAGKSKKRKSIRYWDGKTAERITKILIKELL